MISEMKIRGNIDRWEAVKFSVESKENDQGRRLRTIDAHLLVWEAEGKKIQNEDRLVDCFNQQDARFP